jgi:hypothetical protein
MNLPIIAPISVFSPHQMLFVFLKEKEREGGGKIYTTMLYYFIHSPFGYPTPFPSPL